ncbi:MAG: signal peptidase I [Clostridia bacterium]|nr:signal peptidase I [Clostridia bacterium]
METFCAALAVLLVVFLFIFRYTAVEGDSMLPTLHGGDSSDHADRLIISDLFYTPKTGDIVVVMTNASDYPLIKRVIATEGQTVRINFNTWEVTVDGVTLDETYIKKVENAPMASGNMRSMYGIDANGVCEFTVSKGKVFVMGDNRNNSKDSRYQGVGEQDVDHILGRVILRLYPFSEFGKPAGT